MKIKFRLSSSEYDRDDIFQTIIICKNWTLWFINYLFIPSNVNLNFQLQNLF